MDGEIPAWGKGRVVVDVRLAGGFKDFLHFLDFETNDPDRPLVKLTLVDPDPPPAPGAASPAP